MGIAVKGFNWDEGNLNKCQKHGLSIEEIENFFKGEIYIAPDRKHSDQEERFLAVGNSASGRPMFVVFTLREELIRPISARYMHEKERRNYEKKITENEK